MENTVRCPAATTIHGLPSPSASPLMVRPSEPAIQMVFASVVVGMAENPPITLYEAYRWEEGITEGLGDLPGGEIISEALAVSADGLVVVGYGDSLWGTEAFSWEEGVLVKHDPEDEGTEDAERGRERRGLRLTTGLRSTPLTFLVVVLFALAVWGRWFAIPEAEAHPGADLRRAQLRSEVIESARLFRYESGHWPDTLAELVRKGHLKPTTLLTVQELGWDYEHDAGADRFSFGSCPLAAGPGPVPTASSRIPHTPDPLCA